MKYPENLGVMNRALCAIAKVLKAKEQIIPDNRRPAIFKILKVINKSLKIDSHRLR